MRRHFVHELDELKSNIIRMATLAEQQVDSALEALESGSQELCALVKGKDREIDAYDNLIKAQVENLIALYQPVAGDLRMVLTALMMNNQLERCGDIAVNIVQRVKKLEGHAAFITEAGIPEMGRIAGGMVRDAIDAFVNGDCRLARGVLERDNIVDGMNKSAFSFLTERMQGNSALVTPGAHMLILTRHLERLADHATNIAEDVIFLIENVIVSHGGITSAAAPTGAAQASPRE